MALVLATALPGQCTTYSASPFIADGSSSAEDYGANFISAPHLQMRVARKLNSEPCGTYDGILITPWRPFQGFKNISFVARGQCNADTSKFEPGVVVQFGTPGQITTRAFVPCSQAKHIIRDDGLEELEFTAAQFGIKASSVVRNIVIADLQAVDAGSFEIGSIHINDQLVKDDVSAGVKTFDVSNCSPTGPLQSTSLLTSSGSSTGLKLVNGTSGSVTVYITLGTAVPNSPCEPGTCVQDVTQLFPGVVGGGGPLVGSITLTSGQSVSYTGSQTVSGNLAFGAVFQNCPRSGFNNGMNYSEFTLNPPVGPNPSFPFQEAVDISCVGGVNADVAMAMTNSSNQPDTTWSNGIQSVTAMENSSLHNNLNIPGVFPPGCDDCADRTTINPPPCFAGYPCNSQHICNLQRSRNDAGGTVTVTFKGFFN